MASNPAFEQVNRYLHTIGQDGRYNRDRIFASLGIPPGPDGDYGQRFGLDDRQRQQVQAAIERELGQSFPGGVEIDPAGNMNENEGFGKQAKRWGPIVGAAALTAFGIPGFMPGLLTGGGGAAAGAAGAGAGAGGGGGATLSGLYTLPGQIASQGVSSSLAGAGAAAAGGTGAGMGIGGIFGTISKFANNPLVQAGVNQFGSYMSNRAQANASRDAADAQLQATREALDFEKGVYADDKQFFQPYGAAGQQSIARLSDLVAQPQQPVSADSIMTNGRPMKYGNGVRLSDLVRY